MTHRTTSGFWRRFQAVPRSEQRRARANYQILRANPRHPSLRLKQVDGLWSARVGRDFRVVAYEDGGTLWWFWIGPHDEYDALLKRNK